MAGRILNRRELRQQADQAEKTDKAAMPVTKTRKKAAAKATTDPKAPKVRKPRAKKAPPRMYARWGIFDGGMKQVAIFEYRQRVAAEEKLADLRANKKGVHFMQIVKEPMPEPVATEATPA